MLLMTLAQHGGHFALRFHHLSSNNVAGVICRNRYTGYLAALQIKTWVSQADFSYRWHSAIQKLPRLLQEVPAAWLSYLI